MTELAGTAVGTVALGIQVCQGLFKYCSAVKGRNQTVDDISRQIQALESTFCALEVVLPRAALLQSSDQNAIASVKRCMDSCGDGVKDLQKFHDSIAGPPSSDDVKGKVKDVSRKLAFGFRQDELASLLQKVQGLTGTAELALQILSLDVGINHRDQVASLSADVTSKLALVEAEIASTSTAVLTAVDTASRDTNRELAVVSRDMQNRMGALERLVTNKYEQIHSHVVSQGSSPLPSTRLLERPSMLGEAYNVVNSPSTGAVDARTSSHRGLVSSRCGCDFRHKTLSVTASGIRIGGTVLSNEYHEISRHFSNCPFYTKLKAQRRVSAQFGTAVWPQVSMLVQASLACTRGVGRGFSISPQLSFRMTVDEHKNPAIREIESLEYLPDGEKLVKQLPIVERKILKMFQAGEASPHDRFPDGSNLLHRVIRVGIFRYLLCSPDDLYRHGKVFRQLSRFIEALVNAGIPSDEVDLRQRAPIDLLVRDPVILGQHTFLYNRSLSARDQSCPSKLAQTLASLSDDMPRLNSGSDNPLQTLAMLMISPILRHNLGLPPLAVAILSNSEEHVRSTLAKYPHSIYERTYGMTPLHLSSSWPTGLSILLTAGAAGMIDEGCTGRFGEILTTIDFALYFGCGDAVALLFDAGCSWNGFNYRYISARVSADCLRTVARMLADRRRRLMRLAEENLTERELATVHRGAGVLDLNAATVVRLLRDGGVDVPTALAVPDSYATIYLSGHLRLACFPIFFDHGFHDVNHAVGGCSVPIQFADIDLDYGLGEGINFLEPKSFQWLDNHGFLDLAPAHALPPGTNTSATGRHIAAARLGDEHPLSWPGISTASEIWPSQGVFEPRVADGCRCACSTMGCLPVTKYLKAVASSKWGGDLSSLAFGAEVGGTELAQGEVVEPLVRFLTFEALEMTHTCCTATREYPPDARFLSSSTVYTLREFEGSVEEIHDEEEELHRRLEELLSEFDAHLMKSGEKFADFVRGYWKERMTEECVPLRDGNEVAGDDLGVVFEDNYKTPRRLKRLLGLQFRFRG